MTDENTNGCRDLSSLGSPAVVRRASVTVTNAPTTNQAHLYAICSLSVSCKTALEAIDLRRPRSDLNSWNLLTSSRNWRLEFVCFNREAS